MRHLFPIIFVLTIGILNANGQDLILNSPTPSPLTVVEAPEPAECSLPHDSLRNQTVYALPDIDDELEDYAPDFESVVFVPKHQWIAGFSVSYTQSTQNDYQFFILENLNADTYSFKITPMLAYAVKNDLALGAKFSYARNLAKVEKGSFVLDSETDYSLDNIYRLAHNFYGMLFMRNYFSLGSSKRFGFFSELQFQLGGGQAKLTQGRGEDITGAYERNFSLDIGLAPGIVVFLNNYSALEVNVGVLGFSYTHTKTLTDRIYEANRKSKLANFRINLFSITFGTSFYL
ncbi:MAG: hypothetical protein HDS73_03485 [Bacteroidales bacterium]|nr:hypothetical protein [Bacteroidales bacterium]